MQEVNFEVEENATVKKKIVGEEGIGTGWRVGMDIKELQGITKKIDIMHKCVLPKRRAAPTYIEQSKESVVIKRERLEGP